MTYSESAPTIDKSFISQSQGMAIASSELGDDGALGESSDGRGSALERVETAVAVGVTLIIARSNVPQATFPLRVAAKRSLIVDTPSQDFAVVSEGSDVHSTACDMNDANTLGGEERIETWALYIDGILGRAETKLARGAFTHNVHVEALGGRIVDDDLGLDGDFDGFGDFLVCDFFNLHALLGRSFARALLRFGSVFLVGGLTLLGFFRGRRLAFAFHIGLRGGSSSLLLLHRRRVTRALLSFGSFVLIGVLTLLRFICGGRFSFVFNV